MLPASTKPAVDGPSRRSILADQLIACKTLHNARPERVRQVLGDPDRTIQTNGGRLWFYLVGPGPLLLDDAETVVNFKQDRVSEIYDGR